MIGISDEAYKATSSTSVGRNCRRRGGECWNAGRGTEWDSSRLFPIHHPQDLCHRKGHTALSLRAWIFIVRHHCQHDKRSADNGGRKKLANLSQWRTVARLHQRNYIIDLGELRLILMRTLEAARVQRCMIVAVLLFVGCSSGAASVEPSGSAVADPSALSPTLPGETLEEATNRLTIKCLDDLGAEHRVSPEGNLEFGPTADLNVSQIFDYCQSELRKAGLDPDAPLTAEELAADYQDVLEWVQCLRGRGLDPGDVISETEYLNSNGNRDPLPGYVPMVQQLSGDEQAAIEIECPRISP